MVGPDKTMELRRPPSYQMLPQQYFSQQMTVPSLESGKEITSVQCYECQRVCCRTVVRRVCTETFLAQLSQDRLVLKDIWVGSFDLQHFSVYDPKTFLLYHILCGLFNRSIPTKIPPSSVCGFDHLVNLIARTYSAYVTYLKRILAYFVRGSTTVQLNSCFPCFKSATWINNRFTCMLIQ